MSFYDKKGVEIDIQGMQGDSVVVARVLRPMNFEDFSKFCKNNASVASSFAARGMRLVFCPPWVEIKEWRPPTAPPPDCL